MVNGLETNSIPLSWFFGKFIMFIANKFRVRIPLYILHELPYGSLNQNKCPIFLNVNPSTKMFNVVFILSAEILHVCNWFKLARVYTIQLVTLTLNIYLDRGMT